MSEIIFINGLEGLTVLAKSKLTDNYQRGSAFVNGCVATIGSFDGVHRGHQNLLDSVKALALQHNVPSVVMLFEPQPHEYFSKEKAPARLMRLREKVCALRDHGVDHILCLKFDRHFRSLSASDFVKKILVDGLNIKHLVVGDDFRFGCDRTGDFTMLEREGKKHCFSVQDTKTLIDDSKRISSTRIRALLEQDELDQAAQLLGRSFSVSGRVVYGKQLGRTLGFPTANIGLGRYRSPIKGVYAVKVNIIDEMCIGRDVETDKLTNNDAFKKTERFINGVANVGVRPTVGGLLKPILEIHLFDFDKQIYGSFLTCVFLKKIREEKTFASLDELTSSITNDACIARSFFA